MGQDNETFGLTDADKPIGQPHWRQLKIVSPKELAFPVGVIGAGSVGSLTTLALAKMGVPDITVFEDDTVSDAAIAAEFFGPADCGIAKLEALARNVHRQTATPIKGNSDFRSQPLVGVVINTSAEDRAEVWRRVKLKPRVKRFIDASLVASHGVIFIASPIDSDDIRRYEATLQLSPSQRDGESGKSRGGGSISMAHAMVTAGFTANLVKRHARRERLPVELRFDCGRSFVEGVDTVSGSVGMEARPIPSARPIAFDRPITVIGAGAIGSMAVLALAKMGVRHLVVYDFDTVEDHNYPNQYYGPADIKRPKVEALQELVERQTGVVITARNERFETQGLDSPVIVAVDSMKVRMAVWRHIQDSRAPVSWLIDPRMGGQVGNIYSVFPEDLMSAQRYGTHLYSDEDAVEDQCTARAIIYNVMVIGGAVADLVRRISEGMPPSPETNIDLVNMFMVAE